MHMLSRRESSLRLNRFRNTQEWGASFRRSKEDIRERFVYGFRLIYQIEKKRILLATIIHGSSTRLLQAFVRRVKREKEI